MYGAAGVAATRASQHNPAEAPHRRPFSDIHLITVAGLGHAPTLTEPTAVTALRAFLVP